MVGVFRAQVLVGAAAKGTPLSLLKIQSDHWVHSAQYRIRLKTAERKNYIWATTQHSK